ncbi:DnaB-like helicase N-terminal domain-containing protein [Rhodococcus erythropolis]|uniref:DnaB-like helicase N-terminal domain-containing protein n=2 Tax=Rhodococcus TaxID=1827 RepID=UPI00040959F2
MPTGDSKDPDVTLSLATVPVPDFDDLTDNEAEIDEYSTALDVEAQLLCSLLWAPAESAKRTVAALTSADFYRPVNAALFTAISELVDAGKPHNSAHVFTTLQQEGRTSGHLGKQLTKALTDITTIGVPSAELEHNIAAVLTQHTAADSAQQHDPSPKPPKNSPKTNCSSTCSASAANAAQPPNASPPSAKAEHEHSRQARSANQQAGGGETQHLRCPRPRCRSPGLHHRNQPNPHRRSRVTRPFDLQLPESVQTPKVALEQTGTQNMNDDEHDAWQLHHHGADWDEIGTEMGCSPTTAQTLAAAYEKRTDNAAAQTQNTLF